MKKCLSHSLRMDDCRKELALCAQVQLFVHRISESDLRELLALVICQWLRDFNEEVDYEKVAAANRELIDPLVDEAIYSARAWAAYRRALPFLKRHAKKQRAKLRRAA